jgi:hypothetical protein
LYFLISDVNFIGKRGLPKIGEDQFKALVISSRGSTVPLWKGHSLVLYGLFNGYNTEEGIHTLCTWLYNKNLVHYILEKVFKSFLKNCQPEKFKKCAAVFDRVCEI